MKKNENEKEKKRNLIMVKKRKIIEENIDKKESGIKRNEKEENERGIEREGREGKEMEWKRRNMEDEIKKDIRKNKIYKEEIIEKYKRVRLY